ncbi:hypothetical protein CAMGR0001_1496 [Campylobacter gracilis RM3268]|uniref:Uncharacterized protein n=1 Tax=Campylobacter gracilis RM3268 TaxID=553220 RepID=C8PJU5_9BACT|nr:hypothetical protein CAMGR0001_1496 [Campylobacter gracilis RM3268]
MVVRIKFAPFSRSLISMQVRNKISELQILRHKLLAITARLYCYIYDFK